MEITKEELMHLEVISKKINEDKYKENETAREHDELIGLYHDIIEITAKKGKSAIIYGYAALLEEQNQFFIPEDIFLFAKKIKKAQHQKTWLTK